MQDRGHCGAELGGQFHDVNHKVEMLTRRYVRCQRAAMPWPSPTSNICLSLGFTQNDDTMPCTTLHYLLSTSPSRLVEADCSRGVLKGNTSTLDCASAGLARSWLTMLPSRGGVEVLMNSVPTANLTCASLRAWRAISSRMPPPVISITTRPAGTRQAQYSNAPFPLPIRVSLPFTQTGTSGKTRRWTWGQKSWAERGAGH